ELEDGLRGLRGSTDPVSAQIRSRYARAGSIAVALPRHADEARSTHSVPHAQVRGEPSASAILHSDRTWLRPGHSRGDPPRRCRVGALGRDRLLAIHAELAGGSLVLNEIAETRANLLDSLFPGDSVTRFDAAHIHDHLDAAIRPSVVLMNPPFSAAAHVD